MTFDIGSSPRQTDRPELSLWGYDYYGGTRTPTPNR